MINFISSIYLFICSFIETRHYEAVRTQPNQPTGHIFSVMVPIFFPASCARKQGCRLAKVEAHSRWRLDRTNPVRAFTRLVDMMVNSARLLGGLTCCTQYNWPMSFSPERTHVRAVGREIPSAENTASNSYTPHTLSVLTAPMPGVCVDVSEKVRVRV